MAKKVEKHDKETTDSYDRVERQIIIRFKQLFNGKIDLSNVADKSVDTKENAFLTRSFAALALMDKVGLSAADAANCITDDGQDDGIDAIYCDERHKEYI